jgi:tetratricopeptide (TPR) repeat protein
LSTKASVAFLLLAAWAAASPAPAATTQDPAADAEIERHLTTVRAQVANSSLDLAHREELAVEMAGTLDRAAQTAKDAPHRRQRWAQAVDLLDKFLTDNVEPPRRREIRFQAGVYRWATAQSWLDTAEVSPGDAKPRQEAASALDDAIERFRSVGGGGDNPALGDNLRFRLAEALIDRARLEPSGSAVRQSRESEALDLLENPPGEPGLAGFWCLLKADLLGRTGKLDEAEKQLEAASRSTPPPSDGELAVVKVPLLLEKKKFAEAVAFLSSSKVEAPAKALWTLRARLAQLAGLTAGQERIAVETDLFRAVGELRKGSSPEARQALLELAQSRLNPDSGHTPEVWDAMAAAYGTAGDPASAGAQMTLAANRALALGRPDDAKSYRLRAGGFLYQAGNFAEADTLLSGVADKPGPTPLRAKAGMLRALARGRSVALALPGSSRARYIAALERQVRDFPGDPSTDEARWLLGTMAADDLERERALQLWSAIDTRSPHWLESRQATLKLDRDQLELKQLNPDRKQLADLLERADQFAIASINQARTESDKTELHLERARLALTPSVGFPERARELCELVSRQPADPVHQYRARMLRLVALVQMSRYVEAEREAYSHPSWRVAGETSVLFDAIRLLDQCASTAESDLRQRRFGLTLKLLIEPVLKSDDEMPPSDRTELAIRETRALLFTGADRDARRSLSAWGDLDRFTQNDRILRDLGDTYNRLEIYSHAVDVERLRMKNNPPGSLAWFDARYGLALAYFHTGKLKQAAQLIDSTAILHPELGGGILHDKFIRLRQRLGMKP